MPPPCSGTVCSCGPHASGRHRPGEVLSCLHCASLAFMGHFHHPTASPSPPPWGGAARPGCAPSLLAQAPRPSGSAAAVRGRQAVAAQHPTSPGGSVGHCPHRVTLRVREHMTPSLFLSTRVPLRSVCSLARFPWKEGPFGVQAPLLAIRDSTDCSGNSHPAWSPDPPQLYVIVGRCDYFWGILVPDSWFSGAMTDCYW